MKNILSKLLILFALLFGTISLAQKHEFRLGYRIGLDVGDGKSYNTVLTTSYDQGLTLQFKYRIWEKAKLYAVLGYDRSITKYNIHNDLFGKPEESFKFNTVNVNRDGIHFGLSKKFVMNKFSINIGISYVSRIKIYRNLTGSATGGFNEFEGTSRTFNFETLPYFRDGGLEVNAIVMYDFSDKFSLSMGVSHSRNHFLKYQSSATLIDASGITTTSNAETYFEADNFIFLNVGIVYKL